MEDFLKSLTETGQPVLNPGDSKPEQWLQQALKQTPEALTDHLKSLHKTHSLSLPGEALAFHKEAAVWGTQMIFILCAASAFREIETQELLQWLEPTLPWPDSPEAHFSADLCMLYLSDIHSLVSKIADGDPLLLYIENVALSVPLSSIGIPLSKEPQLDTINMHKGLQQLHAERVVSLTDHERSKIPSVSSTIHRLVGGHHKTLSPTLTNTLL